MARWVLVLLVAAAVAVPTASAGTKGYGAQIAQLQRVVASQQQQINAQGQQISSLITALNRNTDYDTCMTGVNFDLFTLVARTLGATDTGSRFDDQGACARIGITRPNVTVNLFSALSRLY